MSNKTHGMRFSKEYKAWSEAKQRCHNPLNDKYKWYGARGITVCDAWRSDFLSFFSHIGIKPEGFELDRKDNSKGYEPGNVRWVSRQVNVRNRRNSLTVVYEGSEMTLDEYANIVGVQYGTAWARLKKHPHLIAGGEDKRGESNRRRAEAKTL